MNTALIITGIGDETHYLEQATRHWPEQCGLLPVVHAFGWEGDVEEIDNRLEQLREYSRAVGATAVVGVSAGASAGALLATETPGMAYANVCGRLHQAGNNIYKFEKYQKRAPIFIESVNRAEQVISRLDPTRSLVFRARIDEMVPREAARVDHVRMLTVPVPSHRLGIYYTLRYRGRQIADLIS